MSHVCPRIVLLAVVSLIAAGVHAQHANINRGFEPDKVYSVDGIDSISLFNGSLTLVVPLGQEYKGNGALRYRFAVTYNSHNWDYKRETFNEGCPGSSETYCDKDYKKAFPTRRSNAGMGWLLSLGRVLLPDPYPFDQPGRLYESPDGADHVFFEQDSANETVFYTTDGSFLRMEILSNGDYRIDFPDGMRHTFGWLDNTRGAPVKRIEDRHGNYLEATYTATRWTFSEYSAGGTSPVRQHFVTLQDVTTTGHELKPEHAPENYNYVIEKVDLAASGGERADYEFTYTGDRITYGCYGDDRNISSEANETPNPKVARLRSIVQPDDSTWTMDYHATFGASSFCGAISKLVLPTKGELSWTYNSYTLPTHGCSEALVPGDVPPAPYAWVEGVASKSVTDPVAGTPTGRWTYKQDYDLESGSYFNCWGRLDQVPKSRWSKTTVERPDGHKSEHYFSLIPWSSATLSEYGLPFTRSIGLGGGACSDPSDLCLSSIEYSCSGTTCRKERSHYVRYVGDGRYDFFLDTTPSQYRREVARHTVYHHPDGDRSVTNTRDEYDGLGNFRLISTTQSWDAFVHEEFIRYNPNALDVTVDPDTWVNVPRHNRPATNDPWFLGLFDEKTSTEGSSTFTTQYCFDAGTGFLLGRRAETTTPAHDVIVRYSADNYGNVQTESFYGGEANPLPATDGCAQPASQPTYKLTHTYSAGARSKSQYDGAGFYSLDLDLDTSTGLPTKSRDTAGVTISLKYGVMDRLEVVAPVAPNAVATTSYAYTNATSVPAQVDVEHKKGTAVLAQESYQYDGFGRLWREKKKMPDGTWSVRQTTRNGMGQVVEASEYQKLEVAATETEYDFQPRFNTKYTFDAFGRTTTIERPDLSTITNEYTGIWLTTRKRKVGTSATGETEAKVVEAYDHLGRLRSVGEPKDSSSTLLTTTYAYDAAGRVTSVTQQPTGGTAQPSRTFKYDGRGFLTREWHPENGTTEYEYDAGGNVTYRSGAATSSNPVEVAFEYDAAMRLKLVEEVNGTNRVTLNEMDYDTASSLADYSNGKLVRAVTHNHQPDLGGDVTVTETYKYTGLGGRLSSKKTAISTGATLEDTYSYTELGALKSLSYPKCSTCPGPDRTVSYSYTNGFLSAVPSFASSVVYHPNLLLKNIQHLNADGTAGPLYEQGYSEEDGMPRPRTIGVSGFCSGFEITLQPQSTTISGEEFATLTVTAPGATTYEWFTGSGFPVPDDDDSIEVRPPVTTSYWVRAGNGECTIDSAMATVTVEACPEPAAVITAPDAVNTKATGLQASTPAIDGATYAWTLTGDGAITSAATGPSIEFQAGCTGPVNLTVTVTASCGSTSSASKTVSITRPRGSVSGSATIAQGDSTEIQASLTGQGPWTLTWSPDGDTQVVQSSPARLTVWPDGTTTYSLASVVDSKNCSGTTAGSGWEVTVVPPPPLSLAATAVSTTRVDLSWSYAGIADMFVIERRLSSSSYVSIGTSTTTSFSHNNASADTTYVYRVRAVRSGVSSEPSPPDLATTVFFGPEIERQVTLIEDQHILDLRAAVNRVRAATGTLAPTGFTDPNLHQVLIQALHIQQLRAALNEARLVLGVTPVAYTRPGPVSDDSMMKEDIDDLRRGVQ